MHRTHVYSSIFKSLLIALIVIQIIHTYIQIVANSVRMLFMYSEYDEKKKRKKCQHRTILHLGYNERSIMYLENTRQKSAMTDYCIAAILPEKKSSLRADLLRITNKSNK